MRDGISEDVQEDKKIQPGPSTETNPLIDKEISEISPETIEENTFPLAVNDQELGSVILLSADRDPGFYTPVEMDFKSQVENSIIIGGLISMILAAGISTVVSLTISRPINNLKKTAEGLKNGNLNLRAPVKGPGEIRELSMSFNAMAKNLEQTDYLKKKLTQDLSHELRNPVSSIKGYLEAFTDGVLPPDEENLHHTMEELTRLENMTEELHQLALVDFKQTKPSIQPTNVNSIAEKIKSTVEPLAFKKGINFEYKPDSHEVEILADENLLHRAIKNLVLNAINHTQEKDTIEFGIKTDSKKVHFYVVDTGRGIPAEKLPYIFERFYRVDEARSKHQENKGSGLGLSLVKEWVDSMDGKVKVESTEGKGSTFWLTFNLYSQN